MYNNDIDDDLYQQFIHYMEKIGLVKEFDILRETDTSLSDNDEVIHINVNKCHAVSIKGLVNAKIRNNIRTQPYNISLKAYTYDGKEVRSEDSVQFSITRFDEGLPTIQTIKSHIIYYHYPYEIVSKKLIFKKGIVINKYNRLEIRIIRDDFPLKIAKFELNIECDKWFEEKEI